MCYNEAATLEAVVADVLQELSRLEDDYEVIVVDDASSDGSRQIANRLSSRLGRLRAVYHSANRGLGEVYKSGFQNARMDLLVFLPADGQFPARNLSRLLAAMPSCDLALGYISERSRRFCHNFFSRAERLLLRLLFGKIPEFHGIFMVRRSALREIILISRGRAWMAVMELILRMQMANRPIAGVHIEAMPRPHGRSKVVNLATILSFLRQMLALKAALAFSSEWQR
jgi:dolichol-phosphate mannosyltransferase